MVAPALMLGVWVILCLWTFETVVAQCVRCDEDVCQCECPHIDLRCTDLEACNCNTSSCPNSFGPEDADREVIRSANEGEMTDAYLDQVYAQGNCACGNSPQLCECMNYSKCERQCNCGHCNSGYVDESDSSNGFGGANSNRGCVGLTPQWYAQGSVLIMNRVTKSSQVLMQDTTNPARQLNADAFDFGWEGGLDLAIKRIRWDEREFEIRFFGLQEMSATTSVATNGLVEILSDPSVFAPNVSRIDARYTSDLYGIEANWRFVTYLPFKYIAGFRYLGFDDDLSAVLTTNGTPILYRTVTRNDLYGVQAGITSVPDCPLLDCYWLTWSVKGGIYGNDASQKSLFTGSVGQRADDSADSTAFVGELELGLRYPLTNCFTLVGGYRLLILERVAVGSDQLANLDFFNGSGRDDHGNAIFHGASLGITFQH